MTPDHRDLWLLPLGGCGEIGMNLNLYGHDDAWLMVDCGVTFERESSQQNVRVMPDPQFIVSRREKLAGICITHAHEDHVGALADMWPQLRAPVYCTPFTASVIRRKFAEKNLLHRLPLHEVGLRTTSQIGPFTVEWVQMSHSIPEPSGLLISTRAGRIFHTADWKFDAQPVIGAPYDQARLQAMSEEQIDALVCDSTNATVSGWSVSESALEEGLRDLVHQTKGRVVVSCFGSNIARLVTLTRIGMHLGRRVAVLGRSLHNMVASARATGYWPEDCELIEGRHLGYLPREEVMAIATGSQGEPRSALHRMALDTHPELLLDPEDHVVFSARAIPGNEPDIERLIRRLRQKGVRVTQSEHHARKIHASGHPCAQELKQLYDWVRPQLLIPVHGEEKHMQAQDTLAGEAGIPRRLTGLNGDLFRIRPQISVLRGAAETGRLRLQERPLGR